METDDAEGNGPFQVHSEVPSELAPPKSPETLSDGERCARISCILVKKDTAQSLLDTFNDATFGHALDGDDCIKLKSLERGKECLFSSETFETVSGTVGNHLTVIQHLTLQKDIKCRE
ncbi:hypothetical protein CDAR_312361 [Caerostris darwini]|uniref:Uncharacterized protein n=1 Tax=Caerostris darwini TaxID=1538125 RepID=A0AAV4QRD1_9ARAC|nr:hypothetical protein CDAR_312361 [Caerostris darwini]